MFRTRSYLNDQRCSTRMLYLNELNWSEIKHEPVCVKSDTSRTRRHCEIHASQLERVVGLNVQGIVVGFTSIACLSNVERCRSHTRRMIGGPWVPSRSLHGVLRQHRGFCSHERPLGAKSFQTCLFDRPLETETVSRFGFKFHLNVLSDQTGQGACTLLKSS